MKWDVPKLLVLGFLWGWKPSVFPGGTWGLNSSTLLKGLVWGHVLSSRKECFRHFPRSLLVFLGVTEQPGSRRSWAIGLHADNKQIISYGCACSIFFLRLLNVHSWSLFKTVSVSRTLLFQALGCDLKPPQIFVNKGWAVCLKYYSNQRCWKKPFQAEHCWL